MNFLKSKSIVPRDELAYNVKDLLVYCFQHWRSALVLMLVGGLLSVLLGGVSAYRRELRNRALVSHSLDEYIAMADSGAVLGGDERSYLAALRQIDAVSAIDRKSAQLTDYLDHSLLMQIDPMAVATATATVVIRQTEAYNPAADGNLLLAYRAALLNGSYLDELAETLSTKSQYLRELISVSLGGEGDASDGSISSGTLDSSYLRDRIRRYNYYSFPFSVNLFDEPFALPSSVLELRVIASDTDLAGQLMDAMLAELAAQEADMSRRVAPHTLTMLGPTLSVLSDRSLMDTQLEQRLSLYDLPALRGEYTLRTALPTVSDGRTLSAALKGGVKQGVIAAAVLFLGYGLLLCLYYLFSDRALTEIRFRQHYRLLPLSAFRSAPSAVYRRRGPFDRWLRRSDRMLVDACESAAVYEMAAGNLRLYGGELHTVLITGAAPAADKLALAAALEERLSGTKFVAVSNLVEISERLKLAGADGVIFYESFDATRFPALNEELELTERAAVRPLGTVFQ